MLLESVKGTSKFNSDLRAAKRDSREDFPDKKDILKRDKAFIGRFKNFFTKQALLDEKDIKKV